jgi:hypothetical protein
MKIAAWVSVSVLSSVMVPGCVTTYGNDSNEEALKEGRIGPSSHAVVANLVEGNWTIANCSLGYTGLVNYLHDAEYANGVWKICQKIGTTTRIPIMVTNTSRVIYNNNGTPAYDEATDIRARMWYAALPTTVASSTFNNVGSCSQPYIHRFWTNGWDTVSNCRSAGKQYYHDMLPTTRTQECTWTRSQTAFMSACTSVGKPIVSNCNNLLGFDPLGTAGTGCGWLC